MFASDFDLTSPPEQGYKSASLAALLSLSAV